MRRIAIFLLFVASIPLVSGLTFGYLIADSTAEMRRQLNEPDFEWEKLCAIDFTKVEGSDGVINLDLAKAVESDCGDIDALKNFSTAAWVTLAVSIGLPIIYWLTSLVVGVRRNLLAAIFPLVVRLSLVLVAASAAAQGILFGALVYFGESHLVHRVHFGLVGVVAFGGLYAAYLIAAQALSFAKASPIFVVGKTLDTNDSAGIRQLVSGVANRLGAKVPDNIVLGLQPNFFATNSRVQVFGEEKILEGETIYLSAPLLRVFTEAETQAVIGHELGHFIGEDTNYSKKFAPMYRQLLRSIESISGLEDASAIATIPAIATTSVMLEIFQKNERAIGRMREFEADRHGASAASGDAVIGALIKANLVAPSYGQALDYNLEQLSKGEVLANLSNVMRFVAVENCKVILVGELMKDIGASVSSHPFDTHPTLAARASALEVDLELICVLTLSRLARGDLQEFADDPLSEIEKEISMCEHQYAVATRQVTVPNVD